MIKFAKPQISNSAIESLSEVVSSRIFVHGTGDLIFNKNLFSDYFYKLAKNRTNLYPFGVQ